MKDSAQADFMAFDLSTGNCIGAWTGDEEEVRREVTQYIAEGQDWHDVVILDVRGGLPGVEVHIEGTFKAREGEEMKPRTDKTHYLTVNTYGSTVDAEWNSQDENMVRLLTEGGSEITVEIEDLYEVIVALREAVNGNG